jgi:pimeloyl-ACP methyl ester carboxylesterase
MAIKSKGITSIAAVLIFTSPSWAGVGMTMPVTAPAESCSLNIQSTASVPQWPANLLPVDGYKPGQSSQTIDPLDSTDVVSGTCNTSWASCPSSGTINEQDGRINKFLRGYASAQDARYILVSAVWTQLGQTVPGNPNISSCGGFASGTGSSANCATALAQLAVTGRQAFNSFSTWNPHAFPASTTGPQIGDLSALMQSKYTAAAPQLLPSNFSGTIPPISSLSQSIAPAALAAAETTVLQQAYTALWAIRSNDPTWRQYRLGAGWIAVSGEDDTPHRPVNVPTAPFPQFDIPVPVTVNGQSFTLTTRYMLASLATALSPLTSCSLGCLPQTPAPIAAPPVPTVTLPFSFCGYTRPIPCSRLTLPPQSPPALGYPDEPPLYIIYIHGGGSRLEEADGMATQLLLQASSSFPNNTVVVISFDLPNSAYSDEALIPVLGGSRMALDASSSLFEDGPGGTAPANITSFPVLNFEINFINSFIQSLAQNQVIDNTKIVAVMGGSLGGNTSLILQMRPMPGPFPFSLTSPLAIPPKTATVAWSPTSMVHVSQIATTAIVGSNACCLIGGPAPTWQIEAPSTRSQYFYDLYFTNTTTLGGLPPDPEMWYRDQWVDANGVADCKASFIAQSRFDRYEVYSPLIRLWTTAVDTEQAIFSFQTNTDQMGKRWTPNYSFIGGRLLLAAGACDDYDNELNGILWGPPAATIPSGYFAGGLLPPAPTASTGTCNNNPIGNTGSNALTHQDIYGFTHDVANDMQNASGTTLFINDTGHSIHDERPAFFARSILHFLTTPDNNINITLVTAGDDVRWNSEVHAVMASQTPLPSNPSQTLVNWWLDIPLNYWFHPWPSDPNNAPVLGIGGSPDNPCGLPLLLDCTRLITFDLEQNSTHNFTIALPDAATQEPMNSFAIEFISGWHITPPGQIGYGNDKWNPQSIAACLPGSPGSFISDGFNGETIPPIQANNFGPPGVFWTPPSFSQTLGTSNVINPNNCQNGNTNPPANADAEKFF